MLKNRCKVVFVGGIHGSGKSSVCKDLCSKLDFNYVTASEIIKFHSKDKRVNNVSSNQELLIQGLGNYLNSFPNIFLDGHYTLLNSENEIVRVPMETFKIIYPSYLLFKAESPEIIQKRLWERDTMKYDLPLLETMQKEEYKYFIEISNELKIKHSVISDNPAKVIPDLIMGGIINENSFRH